MNDEILMDVKTKMQYCKTSSPRFLVPRSHTGCHCNLTFIGINKFL